MVSLPVGERPTGGQGGYQATDALVKRTRYHFADIAGQIVDGTQLLQCGFGVSLTPGIKLPPAVEAASNACGDLRVGLLQTRDHLGGQPVAAAIGGMEVARVGPAEGAHQGIDLVGYLDVEAGVVEQCAYACGRVGQA